ncbi:MAG: hypothetical protein WKF37_25145, partial [Bryobacteraceae bacterium]
PESWDAAGMGAGFPHSNRLNCVAGVSPVADNPTSDRYFVREAFQNVVAGQFGNCARNSLRSPSTWNVDASALKDFRFNDRHALQFRAKCLMLRTTPPGVAFRLLGYARREPECRFWPHSFHRQLRQISSR